MWVWITAFFALILSLRIIYRSQAGVCRSKRRMDGKTVIVTGSSAGIGKETARDLARRGARVIMACRNVQKAQKIADDIIKTTGNQNVVVRQVDTSDLGSVRRFAKEIINTESKIDVLINNAGILSPDKKELSVDGLELSMATNHFGHFLLTNMLLDLLKASAPSRIVNVSSLAHWWSSVDPDDLNYDNKAYPGSIAAYSQTKLCNVLFTLELAVRLSGTGVTANSIHPGMVITEIGQKDRKYFLSFLFMPLISLILKDEVMGSETIRYLAVAEEVEHVSGEYFVDCKIEATSLIAKDRGIARKLWDASERLVKLTQEDLHYKANTKDETSKED